MKKKILVIVTAMVLAIAMMPTMVFAGTSADKVKVQFSAGVPGAFDMVDESITATGDLAETFFPDIAGNEPEGVSFADVLVAAHIKKYGEEKVLDYLDISNGDWGTQMNKQFGHTNVGMYYANDQALAMGVSDAIKDGDDLYAGASAGEAWDFGYSFFKKKAVTVVAGKTVNLKAFVKVTDPVAFVDEDVVLPGAKIAVVNKANGQLKETGVTTDGNGVVAVSFNQSGEKYISLNGKVDTGFGESSLAGAFAKVTVKPSRTVITKKTAKKKQITLKWKKAAGAKKYQIYRATKKNGTYKRVATTGKTSFTNKKLKKNTKYFYKVRAIATVGGKTYKGAFSAVAAVKTKK